MSAAKPERKQRRQRRTFVLARKTTRDRLTEEKSSCVRQREEEGGSDAERGDECIVLRIDEANKCQRVRDRDRGLGESPVIMSSGPS